jgi:hypothetical protein
MIRPLVALGVAVAVTAVGPVATTASAAPTTVPAAAGSTAVQQQSNGDYITTYTAANGNVTQVYAQTPVVIKAAPETTSPILVGGKLLTLHTGSLTMQAGQAPATAQPDAAQAGTNNSGSVPTAYEELVAMGVDPTIANQFQDMGSSETAAPAASPASPAAETATPAAASAGGTQYGAPVCINQKFDDYSGTPPSGQPKNKGSVAGCDVTYVNKKNSTAWYESDQFEASGAMHDPTCDLNCDHFTGLRFGVTWPSGNTVETWKPNTTKQEGSCTTETASLSYGGAGVSESSTECPETFGYYSGGGSTDFSSKWDGQGSGPSNGSRADIGVTGVYSPVGKGHQASAYDHYWWTSS